MITSREFLDLVLDQMADFGCVTARRMFGGVGTYWNGVMFALIADDVLYLKAAPSNIQDFDAEDLEPITYRTGGGKKAVMSYRRAPFLNFISNKDQDLTPVASKSGLSSAVTPVGACAS
jgi:DNA transformation protein